MQYAHYSIYKLHVLTLVLTLTYYTELLPTYVHTYIQGAPPLQTSLKLKTKHQNKKFIDHIEIFNYGMEIDCWEMKKNTVKSDFKKK